VVRNLLEAYNLSELSSYITLSELSSYITFADHQQTPNNASLDTSSFFPVISLAEA
jgi:hypothetical protein